MQLPKMLASLGCGIVSYIDTFAYANKYKEKNPEVDITKSFKGDETLPISFYEEVAPKNVKFDCVFIEQNGYNFNNDIDVPVIYYHRDTPTPLFMKDMDILLYRFKSMEKEISKQHPKVWGNGCMKVKWLNGVDVYGFLHVKKKEFSGINWVGWSNTFEYYWNFPKQIEYYKFVRHIVEESDKKKLIVRHKAPIPYSKYKDILQKSEAVLIVPGNGSYVTRKLYEAAVSKTLIVLWVQNDDAMEIYKNIGLVPNYNCIMFKTIEQLEQIKKKWLNIPKKKREIVRNAFDWVVSNHTWLNRARELLVIINAYNETKRLN
jgi:glycosyltransferase involved in cell wall biosynthesis